MLSNDVAIGRGVAHSDCHVHRFEDDIVVNMECRLLQNGEVVQGSYHCDEPGTFEVEVCLEGRLVEHLCFDLCAAVHIECFGPADPEPLPAITRRVEPCNGNDCYTFTWEIDPDTLCDGDDCGKVCCFVATVTSRTLCGNPGHIGCACRGPCVMVHSAPAHEEDEDDE